MSLEEFNPDNIDVVILCGGLGRRLRPIIDGCPKPMALVAGRPFLDIPIAYVANFGFRRFILCIGHRGDFVKKYYLKRKDLRIIFSEEERPLGTGGAIKNAESFIKSSPFLVLNGDSFFKVDLRKFLEFHLNKNAMISIVIKKVKENSECGVVKLNSLKQIIGFNEKIRKANTCYINMGIYLFQREIFSLMPRIHRFSLEEDFFPRVIKKLGMYGYIGRGMLIDIGTPQGYKYADVFFKRNSQNFLFTDNYLDKF